MMSYFKMATLQEKAMCVHWCFETKSVIEQQCRYRTQYGGDPPSDNAIRRRVKQLQETGCVLHRKGAGRPSTSEEELMESRKRFLEAHKNQLDELLCS
jgi:hypothetical protein